MKYKKKVLVIGGGAAGFFFGINCAVQHPDYEISILEKSDSVLEKVLISGGGRCNVTHACFDPKELTKRYPRGQRELLGAFHRFQPRDTIEWFESHGVPLKVEDDGRMFPVSNKSESIANCLMDLAKRHGIGIRYKSEADTVSYVDGQWIVTTADGHTDYADILYIATGSSLRMWEILRRMGYRIADPVPSLFTFNIRDARIKDLQGISVERATIKVSGTKLEEQGPLLITHWGLSGPAILRLSAWGARELKAMGYKCEIKVNWTTEENAHKVSEAIKAYRNDFGKRLVSAKPLFKLPQRLWERLCGTTTLSTHTEAKWADVTNKTIEELSQALANCTMQVMGKSTYKDEFVTCGGVELDQVDMKTFESKLHPGLYFGGEVLNIDAITGGYNFQAAWSGSWIAAGSVE